MKKTILILPIILFILAGCGPTITPDEYNQIIIDEQVKITQVMMDMSKEFQNFDFNKAEEMRKKVVTQCEASNKRVSELPDYKGNSTFRDAAKKLFSFYTEVGKNEYKEMITIFQKGKDMDIDDVARLKSIEEDVKQREAPLDNEFRNAQKKFAEENGLSLHENVIQKEIDNLGK